MARLFDLLYPTTPALIVALGLSAGTACAQGDTAGDDVAPSTETADEAAPTDPYADGGADPEGFASFDERVSYAIGWDLAQRMPTQFQSLDLEVSLEQLAAGLTAGADTKLSEEQMAEVFAVIEQRAVAYEAKMREQQMAAYQEQMAEMERQSEANLVAGAAFLEANAKADGVQITDSGLQYQILEEGDGPTLQTTDVVTLHYTGQLVDGAVFQSSRDMGEPITLAVGDFIPGFSEGLQLLNVGSKAKLVIPGEIAYGQQGGPGGPNATLVFEVEILGAESTEADAAEDPAEDREPLAD